MNARRAMRVDGLFGWVEHNNTRSFVLLFSFVLLMQPLAAIALSVPLLRVDPAHAPWFQWTGYAIRYVPAVTLASMALFAAQMWWHMKTVRQDVAFRFVDAFDEPRLCALVEPLAITAGIPTPYVGVLDSPAMNAFACGITRKSSVVVFTRGIIDGLDDDELSSVIAHELIHIRNGDSRLIAAANAFLRNMSLLDQLSSLRPKRYRHVFALLLLPALFLLYLGVALLSQICLRLGFASRLLIAAAREFIADAEAVQLTQHPAALVSALQRIHGNSELLGLPFEQDAMMIDGMAQGRLATHPPILDRIQAIVATTGQMALDARPRRDTRSIASLQSSSLHSPSLHSPSLHSPSLHSLSLRANGPFPSGFEQVGLIAQNSAALHQAAATGAAPRASTFQAFRQAGDEHLILGLRWDIAAAMVATFVAAMTLHHGNIAGAAGQVSALRDLPASIGAMNDQARACNDATQNVLRGQFKPSQACDSSLPPMAALANGPGNHATQDQQRLSDTELAILSPTELGLPAGIQPMPAGGFMIPQFYEELPADHRQATDLMPSYPLPVHEVWQRLVQGSITPFLRTLQCGLLVHAEMSAVTDQSVTWSVTTEGTEQIRLTATLAPATPDAPDATHVTLTIDDFEQKVPMRESSAPNAPTSLIVMTPALKPPLRPYFAEAINAMLDRRLFRTTAVISPPALDKGASVTADICTSQRNQLASGSHFSIHERPGRR